MASSCLPPVPPTEGALTDWPLSACTTCASDFPARDLLPTTAQKFFTVLMSSVYFWPLASSGAMLSVSSTPISAEPPTSAAIACGPACSDTKLTFRLLDLKNPCCCAMYASQLASLPG